MVGYTNFVKSNYILAINYTYFCKIPSNANKSQEYFEDIHLQRLAVLVTSHVLQPYSRIGRAKINEFQTLEENLMIFGPNNSPPKFQPPIQSKSARIKTRIEREL